MQLTGPAFRAILLVYGLGLASMSLWGITEGQPAGLCSTGMCDNLDSCQSLAESLHTALSRYKTNTKKIRRIYNLSQKASSSLELYNVTSSYLNVFKGLGTALGGYMNSSSYRVESRNLGTFAFTDLLRNNLSSLIAFTDRAVDDMAFTLKVGDSAFEFSAIHIEANKTTICSHVFGVSHMFKNMIKTWRQKCSQCRLKTDKRPKSPKAQTHEMNCVCPTNAKRGNDKAQNATKKLAGQRRKHFKESSTAATTVHAG